MTTYSGERWLQSRRAALSRDGGRCQDCGTQDDLHVHHITPVKQFDNAQDAHYLDNLVVLCKYCHPRWEGKDARPRLADAESGLSIHEIVSALESDMIDRKVVEHASREIYDHIILHNPDRCCTCHSAVDATRPPADSFDAQCAECGRRPDKTPSDTPDLRTMLDRTPALISALDRSGFSVDVDALYDALRHLKTSEEHHARVGDIWRAATAVSV